MRLKVMALSAVGLIVGMLAAVLLVPGAVDRFLPNPKTWTIGKADIGGPFSLIDHNGRPVTSQSYAGEHRLVFFGFTYCPDICPAALQKVTAVLDQLGPKADRLRVLFITVDPDRDTPEQLKLYVSNFHSRTVGLTGSAEQVAAAAKVFRIYYRKVEDPSNSDGYTMDHSGFIYLMDEQGAFIKHFTHVTPIEKMVQRLQQAL